jgi:hypothetical protein
MARAEFRADEVLGEVIISDPPLNLFGVELLDELATRPSRRRKAMPGRSLFAPRAP